MDESELANLDSEFKRYLQILRPYLGHFMHQNVIEICNAWIQRLSDCKDSEKNLRNKYVFALCFQVARGFLDGPFTKHPPNSDLPPFAEEINGYESSTEEEYVVIDSDEPVTTVLYANKHQTESVTEYVSQDNDGVRTKDEKNVHDSDMKLSNSETSAQNVPGNYSNTKKYNKISGECYAQSHLVNNKQDLAQNYAQNYDQNYTQNIATHEQAILCYPCPEMLLDYGYYQNTAENNDYRAISLIKKLRNIKTQNIQLHKELSAMKEESKTRSEEFNDVYRTKMDNSTSVYIHASDSTSTLKSLKSKLQAVQESRNNLIETIGALQDKLDNYSDIKKHEIEEIEAKYKLEMIKLKTSTRDEVKEMYDNKIEELKKFYQESFRENQTKSVTETENVIASKDEIIAEKNKVINANDIEISRLKCQIEDQKNNFHAVLNKLIETPGENLSSDNCSMSIRAQQLEKRLNKLEKSKTKCVKDYEAKVATLQREKHLAECSLQLQLIKQRGQVVNEITDENQSELTAALDKLEAKYKEIVANVQATAIQRRLQDQMALESILQAACGIQSDTQCSNSRFSRKTMPNQNQSYDSEISNLPRRNKVVNKSYGEDSLIAGYCLNGKGMGELFDRVHIPQRDNGGPLK